MMGVQLSVVKGNWRNRLAVTTALSMLALPGMATEAKASGLPATEKNQEISNQEIAQADAVRSFDIKRQLLADALALFGQQAGVQVSANGDLVRGVQTPGVSGDLRTEDALQRLLAGTGLSYRIGSNGAITIVSTAQGDADGATSLSPILVEANTHTDDHIGAADRAQSIYVTPEDFERRNPQDVKDVFAGQSAVSVGGSVPLNQKLYVNAIEETNLAISIDGARQNNKVFHHSGTNLIDPSLLKAARVDPGVAPADAGPAALGGAIVYETVDVADVLEPGRSLGGFAKASYDTNGETFTNDLASYGRAGGFELLGYFKWAKGDDYEAGNGDQVPGTEADMRSGLIKSAYEAQSGHRFEFSGEQVRDRARRPYRANMTDLTNRNQPDELGYDMRRRNFTFNYGQNGADGLWDPKAVLAYSETYLYAPLTEQGRGTTGSFSGKFENDFNLSERDTITTGVDFYHDTAEYDGPTSDREEEATNFGGYAQARLQPLDPLRLSFGLRGDSQKFVGLDGTEIENEGLSGNVAAAVDVTEFLTINAGYSNVWGGIALAENYVMNPAWDYSKGVKPVRAENYTTGFEVQHEGFSFNAGIFRSTFDNARDPGWSTGPSVVVDFETRGYNLGAGYNWGPGFARVTYTDSEITLNGSPADSDGTQYLGAPLGRVIALEAAHTIEGINLTVGGTIDAALKNTDTADAGGTAQEAYEVVGLYAEYKPEAADYLTLRIEANNIFDEEYADRGSYGQDFTNVVPLYEPGRSFLLMAKAQF
ncbi:TonB-dependent receptor [Thalassospira povalilytica]|uniref:TonB-dependent receptor n=1 Tax=Thalassospira povalilytica TaxID=732237 RepID=UPI001D187E82|nr:TonB-dependent receptor [Thalassospira povalilytica]MCC4239282.1 TonB-dependent receptor [Thalassospira povalilytica]